MTAFVSWDCVDAGFLDEWYNYYQIDWSWIHGGYSAQAARQTGSWNDPGNVECGRYYP
jgi:hypothetical protein